MNNPNHNPRMKRLIITISLMLAIIISLPVFAGAVTYANNGESPADDPYVLYDAQSGYYYSYSTDGGRDHYFKVMKSADMVSWETVGGVFSKSAAQWGCSQFRSPEVYYNAATGWYYMFYTARIKAGTDLAYTHFGDKYYLEGDKIGVAASRSPEGPFENIGSGPIDYYPFDAAYRDVDKAMPDPLTPPTALNNTAPLGLYISCSDPTLLFDNDGKIYMYYTRGSYRGWVWDAGQSAYVKESQIYCVELDTAWWNSANANVVPTVAAGERHDVQDTRRDGFTKILTGSGGWENTGMSESPYRKRELYNPQIVAKNDKYYLYYTCSGTNDTTMAVGYAVSDSATGTWIKYSQNPVISGTVNAGRGCVVQSPNGTEDFYAYQAKAGEKGSARLCVNKINYGSVDPVTGAAEVSIPAGTIDYTVPSGVGPYTMAFVKPCGSLTPNQSKTMTVCVKNAAGAEVTLKSQENRILPVIADPNIATATVEGGKITVTGQAVGTTTMALKYQKKLSNGTYGDALNGPSNIQIVIPIKVSTVEVSEIDSKVYPNEDFQFTVTTDTSVTDLKLYSETGGGVTIRGLNPVTESGRKIWTVTTRVGSAGSGRRLDIFAKDSGGYYDTGACVSLNVLLIPPRVYDMYFAASSVPKNVPVDVTIETNQLAAIVKIENETGSGIGKTLVSKSTLGSGNFQWVYSVSIGTAGTGRTFTAFAAGANGVYNTDPQFTYSASIDVTN